MTKCKLCQEEIKGLSLTCSKGSLCRDCMGIISSAEEMPLWLHNDILWTLAEVYFRKGKGENITFTDIWAVNENVEKEEKVSLCDNCKGGA